MQVMINEQDFQEGIELLQAHFEKRLHPKVVDIWREYLGSKLSTEQFNLAISRVVAESKTFPTAKEVQKAVTWELTFDLMRKDEISRLEKSFEDQAEDEL